MTKKNTQELLEELDKQIEEVKSSEEFKEMLEFFSKFHAYSYHNTILIKSQKPEATYVAGYKQWQKKFDRHVKEGEEGIAILAPFTYTKTITEIEEVEEEDIIVKKEVEKEVTKTHFKPVYVFDINQTEPLNEEGEIPRMDISLEDNGDELLKPLTEFAANRELQITYKSLSEGEKGRFKKGRIVVDENLNDTEKASVVVHELAHAMLEHDDKNLSKQIREMEAEAVAYVVMTHFNVEIKSDKYLALYKKSYDLKESLEKINDISSSIIDHCDEYLLSGEN